MRQIRSKAAEAAAKKIVGMATRAWLKAVPLVNVLSTAYDIADGVMTAKEFYDAAKAALKSLDTDAVRIRPDFAIEGPDGALADTYDFKFGDDSFDKNPGQEELYKHASGSEKANSINEDKCKCKENKLKI